VKAILFSTKNEIWKDDMTMSVIIPALNEAEMLRATLESVITAPFVEVIVVDGGSWDSTVEVAYRYTSQVLVSPPGRGLQQALGAQHSQGGVLLFLHADTRLPSGYEGCILETLACPNVVFGAFRLAIHPTTLALDIIAFMANLRSRCLRLPYGDQAIFVPREAYFRVGGFRDWPIMEDVDLVRRLKRMGGFKLARGYVKTSARRWQKESLIRTTQRNLSLIIGYGLGVSPEALYRRYPRNR
jgi:rSAM/selenodomain-associated transferase 2